MSDLVYPCRCGGILKSMADGRWVCQECESTWASALTLVCIKGGDRGMKPAAASKLCRAQGRPA